MNLANRSTRADRRNPFPAIVFGLVVIAVGLGGFVGWAALADISSAVVASGTLKVKSNRKKVQTLAGGTVRELVARNGIRVETGDVLLRLDDTTVRSSMEILQNNYDLARATVARLRAELSREETISFPFDMITRRHDEAVADIFNGQRQLFAARGNSLKGQGGMLTERVGQLNEEIAGLQAQSQAKSEQINIVSQEHDALEQLLKSGIVARTRVLELEKELSRLKGQRGEHEAGIARARRLIAETKLQHVQTGTNFDKEIASELGEKEAEMFAAHGRLTAAKHELAQTVIRATDSGVVVGLNVHTIGGVLKPGETLLEIVPQKDNLFVEVDIRPTDIDSVSLGLTSEVVFSAFSQRKAPRLEGEVVYVSADALSKSETGVAYYSAHVSVTEEELSRLDTLALVPGMPVDVMIKTGQRTPLAYLIDPLRDSLWKAWREQ